MLFVFVYGKDPLNQVDNVSPGDVDILLDNCTELSYWPVTLLNDAPWPYRAGEYD
jgi:hypothetical protein